MSSEKSATEAQHDHRGHCPHCGPVAFDGHPEGMIPTCPGCGAELSMVEEVAAGSLDDAFPAEQLAEEREALELMDNVEEMDAATISEQIRGMLGVQA